MSTSRIKLELLIVLIVASVFVVAGCDWPWSDEPEVVNENIDSVDIEELYYVLINRLLGGEHTPIDFSDENDLYYTIVKRYKAFKDGYICKICGKKGYVYVLIEKGFMFWSEYLHYNFDSMISICPKCCQKMIKKEKDGLLFHYQTEGFEL